MGTNHPDHKAHVQAATTPGALTTLLASLDEAKIRRVLDAKTRESLETARALLTGVDATFTAPATDHDAAHHRQQLQDVSLTPERLVEIAQQAVALLEASEARDQRAAQYHASVAHTDELRVALDTHAMNAASKLRGQFGNTSPELKRYGVATLKGGHGGHGHKAPAAGESDPAKK